MAAALLATALAVALLTLALLHTRRRNRAWLAAADRRATALTALTAARTEWEEATAAIAATLAAHAAHAATGPVPGFGDSHVAAARLRAALTAIHAHRNPS